MLNTLLPIVSLAAEGANPLEHVLDRPWFQTQGGFWLLSNNIIALLVTGGLMLLIFPLITRAYRRGEHVPTGTRNFFEAILMYVREEMARPVLGEHTDRFIPFLWTMFFFILLNNLIGLLPFDVITAHKFGGTATANIWVTGGLALVAFCFWQFHGIRANGLVNYLKHFTGGAPVYMAPIMIPLEFVGMFIKPFALAIRLFANMIAGHTVLAVLLMFTTMAFGAGLAFGWAISIVVILASVAMMCLEIFVAFLQTYIFVFLTTLFLGQLVVHKHENHGEEAAHPDVLHPRSGDLSGARIADAPRQAGMHMGA